MTRYGVVGNRHGWKQSYVMKKLKELITEKDDVIVSGGAVGVDTFAQRYAKLFGITIVIHYPDPDKPSPDRYFHRNFDIANDCETLIAFDKQSGRAGTKNTIKHAKALNKKVFVFRREEGKGYD